MPARIRRRFIGQIFGGWAKQDISINRRADQHAFCGSRWYRQQNMINQRARQLVVDDQLPAARRDLESPMSKIGIDLIGKQSGSVDDPSSADIISFTRNNISIICFLDGLHTEVQPKRYAIDHGLGGTCQWNSEGTEYPLVRDKHSPE